MKFRITNEAHRALEATATNQTLSGCEPDGPDHHQVDLDDDVVEALTSQSLPGESMSDTIVRVVARFRGMH
jgi:hypothetical protein